MRGEVLGKGVGSKVGDGRDVKFWNDDWVGRGSLCGLFRRMFRVVSNKESFVRVLMS